MCVYFATIPASREAAGFRQGTSGLYAIARDSSIKLISPLVSAPSSGFDVIDHSFVRDDRVYLAAGDFLLFLDLKADKLGVIYDGHPIAPRNVTPTLSGKEAIYQGNMELGYPRCFTGEALWSAAPLTRVPVATRMPVVSTVDPGSEAAVMLEALPAGRILLVTRDGAWVIDPSAKAPPQ